MKLPNHRPHHCVPDIGGAVGLAWLNTIGSTTPNLHNQEIGRSARPDRPEVQTWLGQQEATWRRSHGRDPHVLGFWPN